MLVWTRCDTACLHLVDPIFTPAHCRKFGGAGSYYKTSVNGRDIDVIRLSTNRWISLLEAKAAFARHSPFPKLECTRKVTDFERADYCLFLPYLDRSSLATICWQRVAAFLPRALIPRCAIPTRAPSLPPFNSISLDSHLCFDWRRSKRFQL
jgi:hypothetical protein